MKPIRCSLLSLILLFSNPLTAQVKFYTYYEEGVQFMEKQDWIRAIGRFKSSASLQFEDARRKRTYGTRFIEYYPHREIGIAHYFLGEFSQAKQELELSIAYVSSDRADEFLDRVRKGISPALLAEESRRKEEAERQMKIEEENKAKREREDRERKDRERAELEKKNRDLEESRTKNEETSRKTIEDKSMRLPAGALTYDASRVTQVGSRLTIAVLPFESKGDAKKQSLSVTDKLVTQLVNLRRFEVMERSALEKVLKEHTLQSSGVVDEKTAVKMGKVVGADAIILGEINIQANFAKVSARVIDTETSQTIVAKESQAEGTSVADIEKTVERVAIMIYNDLPLVEGEVVKQDPTLLWIDIGSEKGIRKGSKCVVFREGETIRHPTTKAILGTSNTWVGEIVVVQVQNTLAGATIVNKEQEIKVGDKVVVK
jgi:TolB-like protein